MRFTLFAQAALFALGSLPSLGLAGGTLSTKGLSSCQTDSEIEIQDLQFTYTRSTKEVVFNVAGTSPKEQNVTASITIYAYGNNIYSKEFDPCSPDYRMDQLCPVPKGPFSAGGSQQIPASFASQIPSLAFAVPDLDGQAELKLTSKKSGDEVSCVQSELSNGRSMQTKGVSYAAAGVAGAAFAMSGVSAAGFVGHGAGAATGMGHGPGFAQVMGWFQTMATSGMLSVNYPTIYRSFSKNFAFSTGLIPWGSMQQSIDSFRRTTGGNLTDNNYDFLRNASVEFSNGSSSSSKAKRGVDMAIGVADLVKRDGDSGDGGGFHHFVSGIEAYAEQLTIPQANTFMTVLLIFAIVVASITVGILLLKVILEVWAMYGKFPEKLSNFRKDYWGLLGRTLTNLILVLYGTWVLYCVYQLSSGDSWAAKLLACATLLIFTAVLLFFAFRIFLLARKYQQTEGDASSLFDDKDNWRKYSLFYDSYKKDCWWLFVPAIMYMFIKGCIIAGGNGHGLVQTAGQLIVEALMLALLLWYRPYVAKSHQWISITIQVVRVLSVICVLIFVEELGLSQTTKTATGIVLIVIQSTLTGVLAILIATNAIMACVRENPHARRKREAEKMDRDIDDLTPLDARQSLLMENPPRKEYAEMAKFNHTGPYGPYKDQVHVRSSPRGSTDNLVGAGDLESGHIGRSESRQSRDSHSSVEGHEPTKPASGLAK
ncbi:transient receptor potential ion channel family protein [Aspergillus glaucus CBS 516.65]|uniref:ML-like domain-containing protein n=1 Tax=Aspergillus glaucus CBS 516.65 TaxID=1160497 RepID=A0A1L9VVY1_ASPGL|nr:hypothetical protein ASPGLDRAFT_118136 [Aspergillus glaucus CBS 516.65]OJJ88047.1 hypothetical protein ASPGLDRAFT_118136 [Aspergillus glaucus CBS 516.65]